MNRLVLIVSSLLLILTSCQSSQSKNDSALSKANSESGQNYSCKNAQQAKEVLYSVKGDIKNYSQIAQCYNQIGKHKVARLFYQKSIDENQELYKSMLGLAKVNDLGSFPLEAKNNYETLYNQIAQFRKSDSSFYFDYALFSLYYRDSRASNLALRRISKENSSNEYKVIRAYQKAILGDAKEALTIWKQISWDNTVIDAYRAFHISHLARLMKDKEILKAMIKSFDLTIPNNKRIYSQREIGE